MPRLSVLVLPFPTPGGRWVPLLVARLSRYTRKEAPVPASASRIPAASTDAGISIACASSSVPLFPQSEPLPTLSFDAGGRHGARELRCLAATSPAPDFPWSAKTGAGSGFPVSAFPLAVPARASGLASNAFRRSAAHNSGQHATPAHLSVISHPGSRAAPVPPFDALTSGAGSALGPTTRRQVDASTPFVWSAPGVLWYDATLALLRLSDAVSGRLPILHQTPVVCLLRRRLGATNPLSTFTLADPVSASGLASRFRSRQRTLTRSASLPTFDGLPTIPAFGQLRRPDLGPDCIGHDAPRFYRSSSEHPRSGCKPRSLLGAVGAAAIERSVAWPPSDPRQASRFTFPVAPQSLLCDIPRGRRAFSRNPAGTLGHAR